MANFIGLHRELDKKEIENHYHAIVVVNLDAIARIHPAVAGATFTSPPIPTKVDFVGEDIPLYVQESHEQILAKPRPGQKQQQQRQTHSIGMRM